MRKGTSSQCLSYGEGISPTQQWVACCRLDTGPAPTRPRPGQPAYARLFAALALAFDAALLDVLGVLVSDAFLAVFAGLFVVRSMFSARSMSEPRARAAPVLAVVARDLVLAPLGCSVSPRCSIS